MKKILTLCIITLIFSGIVFSKSITITSPRRGAVWYKGWQYDIKWRSLGINSQYVRINIYINSISPGNFIEQIGIDNCGKYKWVISDKYKPGKYIIRIRTVTNKIIEDSRSFKIGLTINPDVNKNIHQVDHNQFQLKDVPGNSNTNKMVSLENSLLNTQPKPVIKVFKPDPALISNGEKYHLIYHYKNALDSARIYALKNKKKGRLIKKLPTGKNISGKLEMPPVSWNDDTYLLEVANSTSSFSTTAKVKVRPDTKFYGVKRWKVVHNWRFDGWHVDVNLHGFGFKYLKFFLFNTNTGKTKIVDEKKFTMYQEFTYNKLKVAVIPFSDEKYVTYGLYFEFMNGNSGYLYQDKEIK